MNNFVFVVVAKIVEAQPVVFFVNNKFEGVAKLYKLGGINLTLENGVLNTNTVILTKFCDFALPSAVR